MLCYAWEFIVVSLLGLAAALIFFRRGHRKTAYGLSLFALTLFVLVACFFRNPPRQVPVGAGIVVAAADGRITAVDTLAASPWDEAPCTRVSTYLSLFDVHVNRIPVNGTVISKTRQSGGFAPAFTQRAEKNTAVVLGIDSPAGRVFVRQMTGMMARRIVCRPEPGDTVAIGEVYGIIKLGSRVDVYLPRSVRVAVAVGDLTRAGETLLGRY